MNIKDINVVYDRENALSHKKELDEYNAEINKEFKKESITYSVLALICALGATTALYYGIKFFGESNWSFSILLPLAVILWIGTGICLMAKVTTDKEIGKNVEYTKDIKYLMMTDGKNVLDTRYNWDENRVEVDIENEKHVVSTKHICLEPPVVKTGIVVPELNMEQGCVFIPYNVMEDDDYEAKGSTNM